MSDKHTVDGLMELVANAIADGPRYGPWTEWVIRRYVTRLAAQPGEPDLSAIGRMSWDHKAGCMRADPDGPFVSWGDVTHLLSTASPPPQPGEPVAWCNLALWESGNHWPDDCFSKEDMSGQEGWCRLYTSPPPQQGEPSPAETRLAAAGVFKGHRGLRGLAEADDFWNNQNYGTRLYYGSGATDYLHRDVLRAAVKALDGDGAQQGEKEATGVEVFSALDRTLTPDNVRALVQALRNQTQIDEDGTEVGVSREAVDHAASLIERHVLGAQEVPRG